MARDAIAFLEAEHRQVESLFAQIDRARNKDRQFDLIDRICGALRMHAELEEQIFYPAFLAATGNTAVHHEAEIEHAVSTRLIAQLEVTSPREPYFPARVKVLAEFIEHHIQEEEKPGGMFAEARKSGMRLDEVGRILRARKFQLEGGGSNTSRQIAEIVIEGSPISVADSDGNRRLRSGPRPSMTR